MEQAKIYEFGTEGTSSDVFIPFTPAKLLSLEDLGEFTPYRRTKKFESFINPTKKVSKSVLGEIVGQALSPGKLKQVKNKPINVASHISMNQHYHQGDEFISMCEKYTKTFPKGSILHIIIGDAPYMFDLLLEQLATTPNSSPQNSNCNTPVEERSNLPSPSSNKLPDNETYEGFAEDKIEFMKLVRALKIDKAFEKAQIMALHFLDRAIQRGDAWLTRNDVKTGLQILLDAGMHVVIDKQSNWAPPAKPKTGVQSKQHDLFNNHYNEIVKCHAEEDHFNEQFTLCVQSFMRAVSPSMLAKRNEGKTAYIVNAARSLSHNFLMYEFTIFDLMFKKSKQQYDNPLETKITATHADNEQLIPYQNDHRYDYVIYPFKTTARHPHASIAHWMFERNGLQNEIEYCRIHNKEVKISPRPENNQQLFSERSQKKYRRSRDRSKSHPTNNSNPQQEENRRHSGGDEKSLRNTVSGEELRETMEKIKEQLSLTPPNTHKVKSTSPFSSPRLLRPNTVKLATNKTEDMLPQKQIAQHLQEKSTELTHTRQALAQAEEMLQLMFSTLKVFNQVKELRIQCGEQTKALEHSIRQVALNTPAETKDLNLLTNSK